MATALMGAAIFQRKSRAGWLDELDGIRHDALALPGGEVAMAMAASAIPGGDDREWPEPERLGADDQYGIASLYADDETPDEPSPPPRGRRRRGAAAPTPPSAPAGPASELPPPPTPPPTVEQVAELPPPPPPVFEPAAASPPPPPPGVESRSALPPPPTPGVEPTVGHLGTEASDAESAEPEIERQDNWAQPAPHPIRPNELWHPAVAPEPAAGLPGPPAVEERVTSSDLLGTEDRRRFPTFRPVQLAPASTEDPRPPAIDPLAPTPPAAPSTGPLASEPSEAPMVPLPPAPSPNGLIAGPVGRRVRRDRPADRVRHALPTVIPPDQERSPLPEVGLAPAALPPAATPTPDAPVAPPAAPIPGAPIAPAASVPATVTDAPVAPAAPVAPETPAARVAPVAPEAPVVAVAPEAPAAPVAPEAPVVAGAPEVPVVAEAAGAGPDAAAASVVPPEPSPVATPAPVAPAVPVPLEIGTDGRVSVPGTTVRIGGAGRAAALSAEIGPQVVLTEGWVWVAPAELHGVDAVVVLPAGVLVVRHGATVLTVVEPDTSTFVLVASGDVELRRGTEQAVLPPGTMVMLSPQGSPQIGEAAPEEIEADPIVAENRALDQALGTAP